MRTLSLIFALLTGLAGAAAAQPLLGGFVEGAWALRIEENAALDGGRGFAERAYPRNELRGQLTLQDGLGAADVWLRLDFISDAASPEPSRLDLREAYLKLRLADWLDLKAGRQVATWGTGDLVFANDLFAKDWQAFFTGLDDAYLKPPQDLLRLTAYLGGATAELALSPRFTPDTLPDGDRLSGYNPFTQLTAAGDGLLPVRAPAGAPADGEAFARLFGARGGYEWGLYGYKGFWPTPQGIDFGEPFFGPLTLIYPRLVSAGASLRGPLRSLLISLEGAYYGSLDDRAGSDAFLPNSEWRLIGGVEKALGGDWTLGGQWYGIAMEEHERYLAGLPADAPRFDALRQYLTARLTKLALDQKLMLSVFGYISWTDADLHLRPSLAYAVTEAVKVTVGASLLEGEDPWTQFGQFAGNSNVFLRLRYSF